MKEREEFIKFQSLISQIKINCQQINNSTAFGVGLLAALGKNIYKDLAEIKKIKLESVSCYSQENVDVDKLLDKWKLAVKLTTLFSSKN